MARGNVYIGKCVIVALFLSEVTSWTIDLPEVRKFFFEKDLKERKNEDFKYKNEKPLFYSNIDGNSKHNTKNYDDVYEKAAYAREYGYESYMEKKVNDIVYNGSVYLEGLRLSLENYTRLLEECGSNSSRSNTTLWRPPVETSNFTNASNFSIPSNFSTSSNISMSSNSSRCREVTRTSEHVRRLSELATWATRELQDVAYSRKYKKDDEHSLSMQENELILKLAWFLDRLAHYTGYEPQPADFLRKPEQESTTSTTTTAPIALMSPSEETRRLMLECLRQNSSEPAVDRCRYPEPLPDIVQLMMQMNSNITGIPSIPAPSSSNTNERVIPSQSDALSEQSMELLITADNMTPANQPHMTAVKTIENQSGLSMAPEVSLENARRKKRSIESSPKPDTENHAINFLKYYAKHKVWEGANSKDIDSTFQQFEVKNQLTHKVKRDIQNKKFKHLKLPENPFQDLSKYVKHKPGVNYVKDDALVAKIKAVLVKMDEKTSSKTMFKKLAKTFRQKRSVTYDKDVDLPRESGDPQRDISYYTKNKLGRNYNNNLVQALQVRAGLEQIFNTGNIEVVRRYGANYNPLIPAPFFAGVIKSQADFKK